MNKSTRSKTQPQPNIENNYRVVDEFDQLMHMFPTEHPAGIHGILCVAQGKMTDAIDMLLFVQRERKIMEKRKARNEHWRNELITGTNVPIGALTIPGPSSVQMDGDEDSYNFSDGIKVEQRASDNRNLPSIVVDIDDGEPNIKKKNRNTKNNVFELQTFENTSTCRRQRKSGYVTVPPETLMSEVYKDRNELITGTNVPIGALTIPGPSSVQMDGDEDSYNFSDGIKVEQRASDNRNLPSIVVDIDDGEPNIKKKNRNTKNNVFELQTFENTSTCRRQRKSGYVTVPPETLMSEVYKDRNELITGTNVPIGALTIPGPSSVQMDGDEDSYNFSDGIKVEQRASDNRNLPSIVVDIDDGEPNIKKKNRNTKNNVFELQTFENTSTCRRQRKSGSFTVPPETLMSEVYKDKNSQFLKVKQL